MLKTMLRLCLFLLLCLPLLGNSCDKREGQKSTSAVQELNISGDGEEDDQLPASPIPEPTAALVFGVGALIIYGTLRARRKRD
jgi:hypothetical protein